MLNIYSYVNLKESNDENMKNHHHLDHHNAIFSGYGYAMFYKQCELGGTIKTLISSLQSVICSLCNIYTFF